MPDSYTLTDEALMTEVDILSNNPAYVGIHPDLLKREVELEARMRINGLEREMNNNAKAVKSKRESATSYGTTLLRNNVYKLSLEIDNLLNTVRTGKAGQARGSLRYIRDMDSKTLAYLTLKTVIDVASSLSSSVAIQVLGLQVGTNIENEARCRLFQEYAEKQYLLALEKQKKRSNRKRNGSRLYDGFFLMMDRAAEGYYGNKPNEALKWSSWPKSDRTLVGVRLLHLLAETTGLIVISKARNPKDRTQTLYYVSLNTELKDWIKDWAYKTGLMTPVCLPTVIPPRPYTNPMDGGYHTSLIRRFPLVKSKDKNYLAYLAKKPVVEQMSPVYEAVNTAMATPWKINTRVLDVASALWDKQSPVDCLPPQSDLPRPLCPLCHTPVEPDHACFYKGPDEKRILAKVLADWHSANVANRSKCLAVLRILYAARMYRDDKAIYFPYQLDFRGRIYALPNFLNPQGNDLSKGLLTFAHGKPLGTQDAADWLAIHVANTHGEDKLPFAERIEWTKKKSKMIRNIAKSPLEHLPDWTNADSPFCFLAACFEWDGYGEQGLSYVSSLPVALDGTCSGLQHYSAMLRDEVGGSAVNLVPADRPSDIYAVVAQRTAERLESITPEAGEDYTLAQEWLNSGILNRKITKRAVMTLPYGSTLYSAKEYVVDRMKEARDKEHRSLPWETANNRERLESFNRDVEQGNLYADPVAHAGHWLANHIWDSIHDTVIAASEAMSWLQKTARLIVKTGRPVTWTAPSGLPVVQAYTEVEARRIDTSLSGSSVIKTGKKGADVETGLPSRLQLTIKEETDRLDPRRQASGVAPNFVHSMDASALVFAVLTAKRDHGITDFALIHDSFGTHAANTSALARAIRASFVRMYADHDVIQEFAGHAASVLPPDAELPPLPARGKLDLNAVHDSLYFFS